MRFHAIALVFAFVVVFGLAAGSAQATSVYGEAVLIDDLTGSRSVGAGLDTDVSSWDDAVVSWEITFDGSCFLYAYTLTGFDGQGATISHISLDLTDDAVTDDNVLKPGAVWDVTVMDLDTGASCPTPPLEGVLNGGDIYGSVKAECPDGDDWPENSMLSFKSLRSPVYGDIVIKTGAGHLWNTGWPSAQDGTLQDFIARPNGAIPEPVTVLAICLGAGGLASYVRKRLMVAR